MSFTRMRYHIVTATKYRARLITPDVEEVLYPLIRKKAEDLGAEMIVMGGIEDHVHLGVAIPPTIAVSDFVGKVKAHSSRVIKKKLPRLGHFKWQKGFGGFTVSSFDTTRVFDYVRFQKKHHQQAKPIDDPLWELMETFGDEEEVGCAPPPLPRLVE